MGTLHPTPVDSGSGDPSPNAHLSVVRDGFFNTLGFSVSTIAGLILVPALMRGLGREMYGVYIVAIALQYSATFLNAGIGLSITREVATRHDSGYDEHVCEFVSLTATGYLLFGIAGAIFIGLIGIPLSAGLHLSTASERIARMAFALTGLAFLGDQIAAFATEVLTGMRKFLLLNVVTSSALIVRTVSIIVLLHWYSSLVAIMVLHAVAGSASGIAFLIFVLRAEPGFAPRLRSFAFRKFLTELRFSFLSQVTASFRSLLWRSAPFLVGLVRGSASIVPFEIGQKLPLALHRAGWQAAEVLFPAASKHHVETDPKQCTRQLLITGTRWLLLIVLPLSIVFWFLSSTLIRVWLRIEIPDATIVLRLLALSVLFDIASATSVQILWAQNAIRKVLNVTAVAAVSSILISALLLGRLGVQAAAVGLCLSVCVSAIACCYLAAKSCDISVLTFLKSALGGLPLAGVCEGAALLVVTRYWPPHNWVGVIAVSAFSLCVYIAVFSLSGMSADDKAIFQEVFVMSRHLLRAVRLRLEQIPSLRPMMKVVNELWGSLQSTSTHCRREANILYLEQLDPFRSNSDLEQPRFERGLTMLDSVSNGIRFPRALEVGCSEGFFTELLAPRCERLQAVDISDVALDRARARCEQYSNIEFGSWDLRSSPLVGTYDLIVTVCVLEYILRPNDLKRACNRLIDAVRPGGYFLVGNTVENDVENSWVGKLLIRGTLINRWLEKHPKLEVVSCAMDECICPFEHILLRKRN